MSEKGIGFRVAAVQMAPVLFDRDGATEKVIRTIERCGNEDIRCSHFPGTMLGERMSRQVDAAIRHHAMESGAFVVNATGWLDEAQVAEVSPDESSREIFSGGLCTAVVSPHGDYLAGPLPDGEGMAIAEIDLGSIARQKRTLDTVGHYARPDILQLKLDSTARSVMEETTGRFEGVEKEQEVLG
ncbi:MAG: hypothetical protein JRI22_23190 [Deltaproteobacteria bacterium]|nr:hypothetical protein [Deltaproteobacteria bacterium]